MYQVNDSNYTEQCNELIITIDNSIELMTLIITLLTQLVNYALVPHNTKTSLLTHNQILHKNLFRMLKLSVFWIKRVN